MSSKKRIDYKYYHYQILACYTHLFFEKEKIPTNKEVGEIVGVSEMTVSRHLKGLYLHHIFTATTSAFLIDNDVLNRVLASFVNSRRRNYDRMRLSDPRRDKNDPQPLTKYDIERFFKHRSKNATSSAPTPR